MSFSKEYLQLMPDTVTVADVATRDEYGKRTYATATSHRARISLKDERVVNLLGVEVLANIKIVLAPDAAGNLPSIDAESRLTLPDGSTPEVVSFGIASDEDGPHHAVVWVGKRAPGG